MDMGVEPFLLASVIRAFIAQRLVRTICPECKTLTGYPVEYLKEIGAMVSPTFKYYKGAGCENCRQTGYRGRAAIYEICTLTEGMRRLIISKAPGSDLKQRATLDGMETLRQDGWRRVGLGQTTVEEVVRVTQNDEGIAELEPTD
jgi:type II secretory ATPase GspE/PulE/Tfp pilus assembly ATPase PilB-like protein